MTGKKRKVKDEPIIIDQYLIPKLQEIVQHTQWPYKTNIDQLQMRDQAVVSFFILTGIRNSEHKQLRKKQTRIYKTHILIINVQPSKRGKLREEIVLPKTGGLSYFTLTFEKWLMQVPGDNDVLFPSADLNGKLHWDKPLSRKRVHWIIKTTTGFFPHWFRGVCETLYGKQIFKNDAWALKDFMGLIDLESTLPYVSSQWKQYEKNIFKVT